MADPAEMLFFEWGLSSFFGWGVYGINLMLALSEDTQFRPVSTALFDRSKIILDQDDARRIAPLLDVSEQLHQSLEAFQGQTVDLCRPVLHALGNRLAIAGRSAHDVRAWSERRGAIVFMESLDVPADALENARSYRVVVAGSSWNRQVLEDMGLTNVVSVVQGIDPRRFHPGPKTGMFGDRFAVFSGGKLEIRKGQDIVLLAFKTLRQRHDDVMLMTAWHSPWDSHGAASLAGAEHVAPIPLTADGRIDPAAWARANGIPAGCVYDLGTPPNSAMPAIYREMDAAVFTNRCEGGTNLVAMEAMACGVPCVISANTGHLDLIQPGTCLPVREQSIYEAPIRFKAWGESDLEEVTEHLEFLYQNRDRAREIGQGGAQFMAGWDWPSRIQDLKGHLLRALA